ncbi:MAG TPA: TonB-dependent receptor [Bryobacteraceae bacterium]|nr:TonB-dependent receptor [Bryobacteraceae bacterium]
MLPGFVCVLVLALSAVVSMSAQSMAGLGAINGTVQDATGAVVGGANVIVANPSNGIQRRLVSNDSGYFLAPSLPPGPDYTVTVEKPGFTTYEAKDLRLQVGQNVSLNVMLTVAGQAQSVSVSDSTPIVDQAKAGVSQVVDSAQIQNLPINGRRVDTFVLLTPGVTNDGTFGNVTFRGMPAGNAFLQDGNDTTQSFYNENGGRNRISSNISQDAVQEFQVQASGYSAEFGRAVGGVINTVSKSGTNAVHGTAYWYFRNQDFNARDRYASINPPETRHQAGGSIGGAIVKDRLFYFFNAEVTRRDFPLVSSILNPQFFNAAGTFIGVCGAPATAEQCTNAVNYFRRFFGTLERNVSQNLGFGKLDWRPNDRNSFSVNFNLLNWRSPNGIQSAAVLTNAGGFGNNGLATVKNRWARVAHTGIVSSTLVNEFRFGWFKDRQLDDINSSLLPPNGLISALTVSGQANLGMPNYLPRLQPNEDRFQFADNLSWTSGRHQYKFGVDIAHTKDTEQALFNGPGSYSYGTITDFARDFTNLDGGQRWQSYSQAFGKLRTDIFVRDFNFYAQDQWRITNQFTLNYGVRYEFAQFAQPPAFNPDYPATGYIHEPKKNFAPRLGIAYSFNHGRTVLRAGYGIYYARFPAATIARMHQLNGVAQRSLTLQGANAADRAVGPVFPRNLVSLDRVPPPGTVNVVFADRNLKTPYVQQGDLSVEQELTKNMGITVSYLWNRAIRQLTRQDLNIGPATGSFTYRINDASGNQVGSYRTATYLSANRVDPRYSRVVYIENSGRIWYDGLAVSLRKRFSHWIAGTAAYTWSHSIDLSQGTGSQNTFFSDGPITAVNADYRGEKGSSSLDQRQRFVGTAIVSLPKRNYSSRAARMIANGWQLSLITTAASPQFATPTILVQGSQFPGMAFTNTINGFGGGTRVPFLSRSSLPIDHVFQTDARITKTLAVTERIHVDLNFETFNTFNNIANTVVNSQAYTASAGVLNPTPGLGAGTASGGFPDGTNARRAQFSMRLSF